MTHSTAMRKARRIASAWGVEIEYDRRGKTYWVYGPADVYVHNGHSRYPVPSRDDPCNGDHSACGGEELLDKVLQYAWDLACNSAGVSEDIAHAAWCHLRIEVVASVVMTFDAVAIQQTVDMAIDRDPRVVG